MNVIDKSLSEMISETAFTSISSSIQEKMNKINTFNIGWKCPVCGRGISPNINICPCIPLNKAFTYGEK